MSEFPEKVTLLPARGDRRSIEAEYDAENRLLQIVQRDEEVFGTVEPIEQHEWEAIAAPFVPFVGSDVEALDPALRKIAVDTLYDAREHGKVMDEAAALVAKAVLAKQKAMSNA